MQANGPDSSRGRHLHVTPRRYTQGGQCPSFVIGEHDTNVLAMSSLTEANIRKIGGKTQAEQEEELLAKMQTLSNLLGQVDEMLEDCPSTRDGSRPPTNASRPPTHASRPPTNASRPPTNASRPPTGRNDQPVSRSSGQEAARTGTAASASSSRRGFAPDPIQLMTVHESTDARPEPTVELATYTGFQGGHNLSQGRRRIEGRAAGSSMGSILFGGD